MALYAISDIHLSLGTDKPMDVFKGCWEGYTEKLEHNWKEVVTDEDIVLIPGDVSWATYIENALSDFLFIEKLPGKKIISKGNHDYWWSTLTKMNKFLVENNIKSVSFLHNNFFEYREWGICGTRGWDCQGNLTQEEDRRIMLREYGRLELSLKSAREAGKSRIIAAIHYPPFYCAEHGFLELMKEYGVEICLYGHVHHDFSQVKQGIIDGIDFKFISADFLNFAPERIL